jgi:hypothetical protein
VLQLKVSLLSVVVQLRLLGCCAAHLWIGWVGNRCDAHDCALVVSGPHRIRVGAIGVARGLDAEMGCRNLQFQSFTRADPSTLIRYIIYMT